MIEKKLPGDSEALNETFPPEDDIHLHDEDEQEDTLHSGYDEDDDTLDGDIDPEAEMARRKRKANLIFYAGTVVLFTVVALLGYPQIKRTFFKEQPKQQQAAAGIPVPLKARDSKFTLAGTEDGSKPGSAPSGAVTPDAVVQTSTSSAPGGQMADDTPVAVAPPPSLATAPTASTPPAMAPMPASPVPAPAPVTKTSDMAGPMQAHISDQDAKISALQTSVAVLMGQKDANTASLQQLQVTLDNLQKQISAIGATKPQSAPATETTTAIHKSSAHKPRSTTGSSEWTLRSAVTGMALLGQPNNNELKRVSVGDTVPGLGKILSISEQNGNWVVKGTNGSVVQ